MPVLDAIGGLFCIGFTILAAYSLAQIAWPDEGDE